MKRRPEASGIDRVRSPDTRYGPGRPLGVQGRIIAQTTGHKSMTGLTRYIRVASPFNENAARASNSAAEYDQVGLCLFE